ncbi:MAG: hypothetical protein DRI74_09665 [Bacteroidetes bacterium]|nr:MAG: hypothetical protein DRI74_09665 [Bacteroidota bacterium]
MRITVFILVLFLSFAQNVLAQQWVENGFLETISVDLEFKKSTDSNFTLEQKDINSMLRSIAYTHQKPVESLHIIWEFIASYQVYRQEKGNFKSQIFIKPMTPQGDINLYEFNSAEYILPELQSFRLRIFKEDSSLVYLKYYHQNNISVSSVGQIAHFPIWHQRWAKGWYMKIDQIDFVNSKTDISFERWFQYINDYKAADYLVDALLRDYQKLQRQAQDPCTFLIKSLRQISYLKKLYQMPFYRFTIRKKKDPDKLEQKMNVLSTLLDLNIKKYSSLFKESVLIESISVEHLVDTYLMEEENLLHLQQNYSSIYDDVFNQLAKTSYPTNLSYNDFNFFDTATENNPKGKSLVLSFENRLFEKSMFNIDKLIRDKKFTEALYTINNLERFVEHAEVLKLNNAYRQFKARAAYGMYNSYIDVIEKAIKINNSKLAAQYLKKASNVQKIYPKEIITNGLVEKKLRQLLAVCYSDYNKMIEQDRYLEAAAKRDAIRELIGDFQLEGFEAMLDELNMLDNQALKKEI